MRCKCWASSISFAAENEVDSGGMRLFVWYRGKGKGRRFEQSRGNQKQQSAVAEIFWESNFEILMCEEIGMLRFFFEEQFCV